MKTRLPQLLLAILLGCTAVQAGSVADYPEISSGSIVFSERNKTGDITPCLKRAVAEDGTVTYTGYRHANGTSYPDILNATVDIEGADFCVASGSSAYGTGAVYFTNTNISADDIYFTGNTKLRNYQNTSADTGTTVTAKNITMSDSTNTQVASGSYGTVKLVAEDKVTVKDTAHLNKAEVEAETISLESTSSSAVYQSSLTADTVQLNGSSVEIGGSKQAVINAKQIEVNSGTLTVAADAELTTNSITLNGGKLVNNGNIGGVVSLAEGAEGNVITITDGELVNSGAIESTINMTGGTLVAEAGSAIAGINATGGDIQVDGNFSMTGDLVLGGDAELIFADADYTIDLGEYDVEFSGNSSIALTLADADIANVVLFTGAKEDRYSGYEVTLLDAEGNSTGTAVMKYNANGNVTLGTAAVPEPTTATLSLLALAALATRRRRR